MTRLLPTVLSKADLPEAELCAARLDGELFAVGDGYGIVDQIAGADHRAASLAALVSPRLIAERVTAAWILGALDAAPSELQFCVESAARYHPLGRSGEVVREVKIDADEIVIRGGMRVTSPQRTAVDLVRTTEAFAAAEVATVRRLASLGAFSIEDCIDRIERRRNLPGKRQAVARLRAASSGEELYPPLTRYTS